MMMMFLTAKTWIEICRFFVLEIWFVPSYLACGDVASPNCAAAAGWSPRARESGVCGAWTDFTRIQESRGTTDAQGRPSLPPQPP